MSGAFGREFGPIDFGLAVLPFGRALGRAFAFIFKRFVWFCIGDRFRLPTFTLPQTTVFDHFFRKIGAARLKILKASIAGRARGSPMRKVQFLLS